MKVLFLNVHDDPAISGGGAEVTLCHLTQGLLRHGVEPVMLSMTANAGLHQTEHNGVRIWRAGLRNVYYPQGKIKQPALKRILWHALDSYNLAMQPLLHRVLEMERPDVVSVHNLPGWSCAAWNTIANAGIPIVQVLHDMYLICPNTRMRNKHGNCATQCTSCGLLRLPHRNASKHVSAVVGVSQFILDRHLTQGYFRDVPIKQVIHNARDADTLGINAAITRQASDQLRIGYIGGLNPSKGIELLLQAFFNAGISNAELWIAGSGNADYVKKLHERWASNRVRFLGRVAQLEFYPQVDIVVVPSLWQEPLGMVVAEALAFGKPVIGSRRGGIPEMILDSENGLLFDPDSPGELTTALQRLAANAGLRARMSEAARISAQPFLDMDAWVGKYISLYHEAMDSKTD